MISARRVFHKLKQLAPYALIEILLPGGTLLALGLWLYRRRKAHRAHDRKIQPPYLNAMYEVTPSGPGCAATSLR
jgi:hypothetical protein